ncbi:MAG TPA: hypothetical protein VGF98_01810 [Candidatus Tumulicola sp.]|jgi:hypothetical protein
MLEAWAAAYYRIGDSFEFVADGCRAHMAQFGESHPLPDDLRRKLVDDLAYACHWVGGMEMMTPYGLMENLKWRAERVGDLALDCGETYHTLNSIGNVLRMELNERWLLYVPTNLVDLHLSPLDNWGEVPDKFPSAAPEVIAASECCALHQPTAAVFHLMRTLERGLRALASDLGVSTVKQDLGTWGNLLGEIQAQSNTRIAATPKGPARKLEEEYYAEILAEFKHFKDAWRDRVSHSNRTYDIDEAKSVLSHVRAFMVRLASRLTE